MVNGIQTYDLMQYSGPRIREPQERVFEEPKDCKKKKSNHKINVDDDQKHKFTASFCESLSRNTTQVVKIT